MDYATVYADRPTNRRTLDVLLDESGLKRGEEGRLPLKPVTGDEHLAVEQFKKGYEWIIVPPNLNSRHLVEMGKQLLWTSAGSRKS